MTQEQLQTLYKLLMQSRARAEDSRTYPAIEDRYAIALGALDGVIATCAAMGECDQ